MNNFSNLIFDIRNVNQISRKKVYINKIKLNKKIKFFFPKKVGVFALLNNLVLIEEWCKQRSIKVEFNDYNWVYDLDINKVLPIWKFNKTLSPDTIDIEASRVIFESFRDEISLIYKLSLDEERVKKRKILKNYYSKYYQSIKKQDYMNNQINVLKRFKNKNIFNINTGSKGFETVIPSLEGLIKILKNSNEKIDLILCEDSFLLKELEERTKIECWEFISNKKTENTIANKGLENIIEINLKSLIMSNANRLFVDPLSNIATGPLLFAKTLKVHNQTFDYSDKILIP